MSYRKLYPCSQGYPRWIIAALKPAWSYLIFQDFGKEDDDLSAFNYVVQFTSTSDYQGYPPDLRGG